MKNKVTIIGAGMVGSTIAYSILAKNIVEELAIIDINEKLVRSQVMDLQHSVPFFGQADVHVGTYEDCKDSDMVIISCGASQKPGQSRLELIQINAKIIQDVTKKVFAENPDVVLLMVTNPVDALTYVALSLYPEKKRQIIGSGTILDSSRFRYALGQHFHINPRSVHAYIVGEHGDSEFPIWAEASIGGMGLGTCKKLTQKNKDAILQEVKNSAYAIIEGKQATYYAIGAGVANLVDVVLKDKKSVLPVSHLMEGDHGLQDVCLSMPVVVGRRGIEDKLCLTLGEEELSQLHASAQVLKDTIQKVL